LQTIRVAGVQMNGYLGQVDQNLNEVENWVKKAANQGVELALFPELAIHGHWMAEECWSVAEQVPGGPTCVRLEKIARDYNIVVSVGLSEKENDLIFNCQVLVGPKGYIGKSRKIHMSEDEGLLYVGGNAMPVYDIGKCKVGTIICYDALYPEVGRVLSLNGAEVFLMASAGRSGPWDEKTEETVALKAKEQLSSYRFRCIENGVFAVITNQAGMSGTVDFYRPEYRRQPYHAGGTLIFGPDGELLAQSQTKKIQPDMAVADLTVERMAKARGNTNFTLRKRRPELYQDLTKPVTEK